MCGYSFGGLVAFETARQMCQRDRTPTLLFLVEPALRNPCKESPPSNSTPSRFLHHLGELPSVPRGRRISYVYGRAKAFAPRVPQWFRRLYCNARLAIGLPVPVSMRWEYVEDRYRLAVAGYVPRPFPGRIVLVTGKGYPAGDLDQWTRIAQGGFTTHEVCSAGHFEFLRDEPTIAHWFDLLRQHLKSPLESSQY